MGSGREVSVLGPREPLLCGRLPAVRSHGVTRKQFRIIWNAFRAASDSERPHHVHHRSVPTATSLAHGPTWRRSVSDSSVLSADSQGCALVCLASPGQPWPRSVVLYHLLSSEVVMCWTRRSTRAPGIFALKCVGLSAQSPAGCRACTARPLGGRGWKPGCHCCPRCARLVSLAPRPSLPGPLRGSPHQNFRAEPMRPQASRCGVSRPTAAAGTARSPDALLS